MVVQVQVALARAQVQELAVAQVQELEQAQDRTAEQVHALAQVPDPMLAQVQTAPEAQPIVQAAAVDIPAVVKAVLAVKPVQVPTTLIARQPVAPQQIQVHTDRAAPAVANQALGPVQRLRAVQALPPTATPEATDPRS
ncbi:MAG: hypothetical protein AAF362_06225 [Pseudomonadota bacterium]